MFIEIKLDLMCQKYPREIVMAHFDCWTWIENTRVVSRIFTDNGHEDNLKIIVEEEKKFFIRQYSFFFQKNRLRIIFQIEAKCFSD